MPRVGHWLAGQVGLAVPSAGLESNRAAARGQPTNRRRQVPAQGAVLTSAGAVREPMRLGGGEKISPPRIEEQGGDVGTGLHQAGWMFWLTRKTFSGS